MAFFAKVKDWVFDRFGVMDDLQDFKDYAAEVSEEIKDTLNDQSKALQEFAKKADVYGGVDRVSTEILRDLLRAVYTTKKEFRDIKEKYRRIVRNAQRDPDLWREVSSEMKKLYAKIVTEERQFNKHVDDVENLARKINIVAKEYGRRAVNIPEEKRKAYQSTFMRVMGSEITTMITRIGLMSAGIATGMYFISSIGGVIVSTFDRWVDEKEAEVAKTVMEG